MVDKKKYIDYVTAQESLILDISHKIWDYAELSLKEYKSAALYIEKLKEAGFDVEEKLCGIDTCFSGKFGKGRPYIGILAEFDALDGLSQKGDCEEQIPLVKNGSGHGCGHNMLGAASFGAVLGIKKYLEETGASGTVFFFGCPGEEGGASKSVMARDGLWDDLDLALTWHPGDVNEVGTGTWNSCIQYLYKFKGLSAHAAGNPEMGRSALDAVELMNTGVQYLREHMPTDARIHYAITNTGGKSPNVVQAEAEVLYMVRSVAVADAIKLQARVDKIAEAAAMMTETTVEKVFVDACANGVPNPTLEKLLYKNMNEIDLPVYTEAEQAKAARLKTTYAMSGQPLTLGATYDRSIAKQVDELTQKGARAINNFVMPYYSGTEATPGSSDVGDVSWCIPTAQFYAVCWPSGCPGHSWQNVSCGAGGIGDKGVMYAAKVLCGAAIDALLDPSVVEAAKADFAQFAADGYQCPVPEGAKLLVIE